ncbi:OmpH family outer membrane protein [Novosphingobium sp. 1949]|uniref:OmpH family outer membrane protein n=1 Tax=Novosphingobium organovorum TaxID=2930092 RepID=A0ABT0B8X8_9SPHN|nr:OmpH family outer membrane protein [Novosphingobium organovorum]MCJ2181320.1 OmpH family outer membrane protein [Novosphingobium organovorum]
MNKTIKSAALVAGLALAAAASPMVANAKAAAAPAAPAAPTGSVVAGIGVADFNAIIANSNAFKTAETQRETTYKAQIDQAKSRKAAIEAQLQPLITKYQTDSQAAKPNEAALQQQGQQIQQIQQQGQQELQQILAPVSLSRAYVSEQIEDKLNDAIKNAMEKKGITLLLSPDAVLAMTNGAYSLNQDILNELNTAIPSAQLVPPQGWEPRQVREERARRAAAAGQAAPAAGAAQQTGR